MVAFNAMQGDGRGKFFFSAARFLMDWNREEQKSLPVTCHGLCAALCIACFIYYFIWKCPPMMDGALLSRGLAQ